MHHFLHALSQLGRVAADMPEAAAAPCNRQLVETPGVPETAARTLAFTPSFTRRPSFFHCR